MKNTAIEWCDHSWSPWIGCTPVSTGCANCYAAVSTPTRAMGIEWGKGKPRRRTSTSYWQQPLAWNRKAEKEERRIRVFPSLCDPFDEEVSEAWKDDLFDLIVETDSLDWLLLTKRPEAAEAELGRWYRRGCGVPPIRNLILGVTAENQAMWDKRVPILLGIQVKRRFVSVEPMLERIDFARPIIHTFTDGERVEVKPMTGEACVLDTYSMDAYTDEVPRINHIIFGGESGPDARPCNVEWIRDGLHQCQAAGVPAFVKQLGAHVLCNVADETERVMLKHPKGGGPAEWPEDLRIREARR
ncbi:MAG: DUF5131 family protein [Phycisphaerae bacterium]